MVLAWVVTDRENECVMKILFQALKERCPQAVVKTLMSDDCECCAINVQVGSIQMTLLFIFVSALPSASACSSVYLNV